MKDKITILIAEDHILVNNPKMTTTGINSLSQREIEVIEYIKKEILQRK